MDTKIKHLLTTKPLPLLTIPADKLVLEAIDVMNAYKIGCLLVVEHEELVGVFTERDVLTKVIGKFDPKVTYIHQVMTQKPLTISLETTVREAMQIVNGKRFRHLPVMDENKIVGLISSGDLMHWMVEMQEGELKDLHKYIEG